MSTVIQPKARVRVARLLAIKCPETRDVGSEGTVEEVSSKGVIVRFDPWGIHGPRLLYSPQELEVI